MNTKKQRKLKIYALSFFFVIVSILLFRMNYKVYHKRTLQVEDKLPKVVYEYANQTCCVKADSLRPLMLFVYKSGCPYCEMTLKDINDNIKKSGHASFYFFTYDANSDSVKNEYSNISENINTQFGKINKSALKDSLCISAFPTIYIVDQDGIITEKIRGVAKFSIIDSAINRCGDLRLKE